MTPGRRAWIDRVSIQWTGAAATLRAGDDPRAVFRAQILESIVAGLQAELATGPPARVATPAAPPAFVASTTAGAQFELLI